MLAVGNFGDRYAVVGEVSIEDADRVERWTYPLHFEVMVSTNVSYFWL